MLDLELIELLEPKPNEVLVERLEMPMRRGSIILPSGPRELNRTMEAVVLHSRDKGFKAGDRVLLTAGVTRCITFGAHHQRHVWIANASNIAAKIREFPDDPIAYTDPSHQKDFTSRDLEEIDAGHLGFEDGDPRAVQ